LAGALLFASGGQEAPCTPAKGANLFGILYGEHMSTEDRLARLEEQNYFQEEVLAQLNQVLTRQQAQLDGLEKRLALAEKRIAALLPLLEEGGQSAPPPHYGALA
jgi:SlyX protein